MGYQTKIAPNQACTAIEFTRIIRSLGQVLPGGFPPGRAKATQFGPHRIARYPRKLRSFQGGTEL